MDRGCDLFDIIEQAKSDIATERNKKEQTLLQFFTEKNEHCNEIWEKIENLKKINN